MFFQKHLSKILMFFFFLVIIVILAVVDLPLWTRLYHLNDEENYNMQMPKSLQLSSDTEIEVKNLDVRIIGGNDVTIEEFPFVVSIRMYDQHICGGSIISENLILTSAQCVHGYEINQFSINVGNTEHNKGQNMKIEKITEFSTFNQTNLQNDVALIKLESSLKFNDKLQPIVIENKNEEILPETTAYVLGWGVKYNEGEYVSNTLTRIDVRIISDFECTAKFGIGMINPYMLCSEPWENKGWCRGDIGGPLVANNKLIGIVSWTYDCTNLEYPGVYTNISSDLIHNWIKSQLEEEQTVTVNNNNNIMTNVQ